MGKRGGNIYVDLFLLVLLYNTRFMNKFQFFFLIENKNNNIDCTNSSSLKEEESVLLSLSSYYSSWCGAMK